MKPAYVSAVFRNPYREGETIELEGWLTLDTQAPNKEGQSAFLLISPSLDYDEDTMKIGMLFKDIVSITPAQSVREYSVPSTWEDAAKEHWSEERIRAMVTSGGDETSS